MTRAQLVLFVTVLLMAFVTTTANAAAPSSGSSSSGPGLSIPVRLALDVGYNSGSMVFEPDRKSDKLANLGIGFDFNVPMMPIHTMIGTTFWLVPQGKSGEGAKSSLLIAGLYVGYVGEFNDAFVGPGISALSTRLEGAAASPNTTSDFEATGTCGMAGWRHYFRKGISPGFGITGYFCNSGKYTNSSVDANQLGSVTVINSAATSTGGFVYLLLGWNEDRKVF